MKRTRLIVVFVLVVVFAMSAVSCKNGGKENKDEPTVTLPVKDFGDKGYGLYNYDGAGTSLSYLKYQHQTEVINGTSKAFRLLVPFENTFVEVSGLPSSYSEGAQVKFTLYQNVTKSLSRTSKRTATVYKVEGGTVWLIDDDLVGYVIPE